MYNIGERVQGYTMADLITIGNNSVAYVAADASGQKVFFKAYQSPSIRVPWYKPFVEHQKEMKARIDKTIDFLKGLKPDQLDGREDAQVTITQGGQPRNFRAQNYLYHLALPNFYFHTTTAYNILRSLGIEIGKRDFMGQMQS